VNGVRKEKTKSLGTGDARVAYQRLAEWERELQASEFGEVYRILISDAIIRWQQETWSALRPNTIARYETSIAHIRKHFGAKRVASITTSDLASFEAVRRRAPGRFKSDGKGNAVYAAKDNGKKLGPRVAWAPVSDTTIRRDFACLSSLLTFCVSHRWADENIVAGYLKSRKQALGRAQARTRYLTHEEEARLIAAAWRRSQASEFERRMLPAAIQFAIATGLRISEMMALTWQDVQRGSRPRIAVREGKGGKARIVPLQPCAISTLDEMPVAHGGGLVFAHEDGRPRGNFDAAFASACKRAGLPDVTWHDLRRTCGCRLLQDLEMSMVQVRDWLGHSSVAVTERHYAFLKLDDLFEALERHARIDARPKADVVPLRGRR
jgi:integrase